jgi:oligopeptide transport system substrate-binding protein
VSINIVSDLTTLDPRKMRNSNDKILASMLFDGLMRVGSEGKSIPSLLKDVKVSEDGKRYIFSIKEAYWTNGDKILPRDFVYAWTTSLSPKFISENAYQLFCIENAKEIKEGSLPFSSLGAKEIDESTLEVCLTSPIPYFLELLSFPIFFPVNKKMDNTDIPWGLKDNELISCGPFSLKSWRHNDGVEVIKNNSYWDADVVNLSSIYMAIVGEETELLMFENKELDWAGSPSSNLPLDRLLDLRKTGALHSFPLLGTAFFRLNVEKAPFDNQNIRRAFSLALDRKALIDHVLQGGQEPALSLVPGLSPSFFTDRSEKEAMSFLQKELGGNRLPKITILYASIQKNHQITQAIQQMYHDVLGVDVVLEACEPKVYYSRLRNKDYQMALGSWVADFDDPENFLEVFKYKNGSTNNTQWENASYASLLDLSRDKKGEKRKEILMACEKVLIEEMPIVPLYHLQGLYLKNDALKNVIISPTGTLDFKWAYLSNTE